MARSDPVASTSRAPNRGRSGGDREAAAFDRRSWPSRAACPGRRALAVASRRYAALALPGVSAPTLSDLGVKHSKHEAEGTRPGARCRAARHDVRLTCAERRRRASRALDRRAIAARGEPRQAYVVGRRGRDKVAPGDDRTEPARTAATAGHATSRGRSSAPREGRLEISASRRARDAWMLTTIARRVRRPSVRMVSFTATRWSRSLGWEDPMIAYGRGAPAQPHTPDRPPIDHDDRARCKVGRIRCSP